MQVVKFVQHATRKEKIHFWQDLINIYKRIFFAFKTIYFLIIVDQIFLYIYITRPEARTQKKETTPLPQEPTLKLSKFQRTLQTRVNISNHFQAIPAIHLCSWGKFE